MQTPTLHNRRNMLCLVASLAGATLLSGCGSGGSQTDASADEIAPSAPAATPSGGAPMATGSAALNLALNMAYIGAQYYGAATGGASLPDGMTAGVGRPGSASGARAVSFADAVIARRAAELAADKLAHVATLRDALGAAAAAQPAIDLSAAPLGAFSAAARGAGLVPAGAAFDPYADDASFLVGAFLVESRVAAAYRTLLGNGDAASSGPVAANLADAIHHCGVVQTLLESVADESPSAARALASIGAYLATIDGTDVGDQTLAGATGASSDLVDAGGHPIAFTRDTSEVLKSLYLSTSGMGGFLPTGANGIA